MLLTLCFVSPLAAQQPVAVLDAAVPVLTPFQQRVLLAFSPASLPISLAQLNGTLTRTSGSKEERGTIQFQFGDSGAEQELWTLSSGNRESSKTAFADGRGCSTKIGTKSVDEDASNCLRGVPWFLPTIAFRSVLTGNVVVKETTTAADQKAGLTRLQFTPAPGDTSRMKPKMVKEYASIIAAATADLLVDTATALPKRLEYHQVLNSDPSAYIDVAVEYSDYRLESGLMAPHHIRRYLQRTQESDIQISSLTLR